jgi:sugar/nucleoside kinase (ribokinase family)
MKIVGIGNALVDVLVQLPDDELLKELNIEKGSMNLINPEQREKLFKKLAGADIKLTSGGSVSNTMLALKQLGAVSGYIGKIGNDEYGEFYLKEMTEYGVNLHLIQEDTFSGTALALITPDGERTFCTYLGAAANMRKEDLQKPVFAQYTHLYVEGYLVQNHELIESAMQMARSLNMKVMIDLASFNVVAADQAFVQKLIREYVDVVFANEDEAAALTGKTPEEALKEIAKYTNTVVVKVGSKGSWVQNKNKYIHIPVYEKVNPTDTTAAGDYYAAGFFYGMVNGFDLEKCAQLGSLLSYYVIQVVGTKLSEESWLEIREKVSASIQAGNFFLNSSKGSF